MSSRPQKSSMAELKLRRLTEHNTRLKEDLDRNRVKVSEAASSLIRYCRSTKDFLVPSVWGTLDKSEDPYSNSGQAAGGAKQEGGCCVVI